MGAGASAAGADIQAASIDDIKTAFTGLPADKQALLMGVIDAEVAPAAEAAEAPAAEAAPEEAVENATPPAPAAEAPAAEPAPEEAAEKTAPPAPPAEAPAADAPAAEAAPEEAAEKAAPPAAEEAPAANNLTEEQQANLKKTFELMDANKNGFIEASEFQKACEQFGMPVTEGWVKDIFDKFDINQDAKIDLPEFTKLIVAAVM